MINIEDFDLKLDTEFIGKSFIISEDVDSTNTFLLNHKSYKENGTVLFAERQLKGKGSKDRIWYSAKGLNLTFSILITDKDLLKKNINYINLGASLSVAQSINNLFQLPTSVKWPNDVLINNKKTAGILLESISKGSDIERLVVGIGVNVNQVFFQGDFNFPPTSIKIELKQEVQREKLFAEILNNFEEILIKVKTNPKSIIKDWKQHCKMIGDRISVTENNQKKYGIFYDIDDEGFLLLRTQDKIEKIHYGDITSN